MPIGDVLPEIVLVAGAASVLLFALFAPRRLQWMAALGAIATMVVAMFVTGLLQRGGNPRLTMAQTYAVDGAALWAKQIILAAAVVAVIMSVEWFGKDVRQGEYYAMLLLTTLGAVLMAGAADTMELVVAVLLSSVGSYTLAAFHRVSAGAAEAGMKMFLLGGLTNALLFFGVVLLFGLVGSTLLSTTRANLGQSVDPVALVGATGLIALGLTFKLGAVPAHAWLPDVAQASPVPAAALLSVVPKLGALVALGRFVSVLPEAGVGWRAMVAAIAAATMTLGNLAALWQTDVRRLLGWSSVSQSGYGIMAVVALGRSDMAVPALLFFLAAYAAGNIAAFAVVAQLRGRTRIDDYAGLSRTRPWLALGLALALLSLVGIPPLAGFFAKVALFTAAIDAGFGWLALIAVLNTVVSLFYYLRVLGPMYFAPSPGPAAALGRWTATSVAASVSGVVVLGVLGEALLGRFAGVSLLP